MTDKEFVIIRSFEGFKFTIIQKGLPDYISFDDYLELDANYNIAPDGYAAAKILNMVREELPEEKKSRIVCDREISS